MALRGSVEKERQEREARAKVEAERLERERYAAQAKVAAEKERAEKERLEREAKAKVAAAEKERLEREALATHEKEKSEAMERLLRKSEELRRAAPTLGDVDRAALRREFTKAAFTGILARGEGGTGWLGKDEWPGMALEMGRKMVEAWERDLAEKEEK